MRGRRLIGLLIGGTLGIGIWRAADHSASSPDIPLIDVTESQRTRQEPEVGLCPWREPQADAERLFSTNVEDQEESLILSRYRQEIGKRLGSSYCLNTVVTRLGSIAAIPQPAETYMGAEVASFHIGVTDAVAGWRAASVGPADQLRDVVGPYRIAYFCDGHVKNLTERGIARQCNPPALPDGMLVP